MLLLTYKPLDTYTQAYQQLMENKHKWQIIDNQVAGDYSFNTCDNLYNTPSHYAVQSRNLESYHNYRLGLEQ